MRECNLLCLLLWSRSVCHLPHIRLNAPLPFRRSPFLSAGGSLVTESMLTLRVSLHKADTNLSRRGGTRTRDLIAPNDARYQLRYTPIIGGEDGNRTRDLLFAGQALSQLSYNPINKTVFLLYCVIVVSPIPVIIGRGLWTSTRNSGSMMHRIYSLLNCLRSHKRESNPRSLIGNQMFYH